MINLFQHQQQALDETEGKNRVAYYLDMGLGKTFVGSEKMMKLNKRINLVVCQCSKVQDWIEHFQDHYRGLGSIDFRAAARSVLLIGRVKREPNVRVIVHDKSSLAPEGKPVAFCLDPETGFSWIGEYDITADELLSGAGGNNATKTEQAERLILDLLADGKELASEDIVKAAAEAGISERTVQNAKRNMGGILGARRVGGQWYNFIKKKQPPEPAS